VDRPNLRGCKVLVVEGEMMIAMLIEDMLEELGCELIGPASKVERALELIGDHRDCVARRESGRSSHRCCRLRTSAEGRPFRLCDRLRRNGRAQATQRPGRPPKTFPEDGSCDRTF
jgi:CheY-like chemotaxis protein